MSDREIKELLKESRLKTSHGFTKRMMYKIKNQPIRAVISYRYIAPPVLVILVSAMIFTFLANGQFNFSLFNSEYRTPFICVQVLVILISLLTVNGLLKLSRR